MRNVLQDCKAWDAYAIEVLSHLLEICKCLLQPLSSRWIWTLLQLSKWWVLPGGSHLSSKNEERVWYSTIVSMLLNCVFEIKYAVEIWLTSSLLLLNGDTDWTDLTNPTWCACCVLWEITHLYAVVQSYTKVSLAAQVLNDPGSKSQHPGVCR